MLRNCFLENYLESNIKRITMPIIVFGKPVMIANKTGLASLGALFDDLCSGVLTYAPVCFEKILWKIGVPKIFKWEAVWTQKKNFPNITKNGYSKKVL